MNLALGPVHFLPRLLPFPSPLLLGATEPSKPPSLKLADLPSVLISPRAPAEELAKTAAGPESRNPETD